MAKKTDDSKADKQEPKVKTANNTLKTASVLAFERKLDPSDALFRAGNWTDQERGENWPTVEVREKSVRGTISNRLNTNGSDPAKLDADIQSPNLQTVDVATLPTNADTLRVAFTLRVLSGVGMPSACNDVEYQKKLVATVKGYSEVSKLTELANRYAHNLGNGRFLWRNRIGAESISIEVRLMKNGEVSASWTFDAHSFNLRSFDHVAVKDLSANIRKGLLGEETVLLDVAAYVRIGRGQEVFPSQELILDKKGQKSKTLYKVKDVAAIHSQKIGNALRTIDTWYPNGTELGPIAVEPYGSVTSQGKAYRQPRERMDFYTLLDDWVLRDKAPSLEQQHYVIANLIRGGVFGEAEKD